MTLPSLREDRLTLPHVGLAIAMGALGVMATFPAWQDIYVIASHDEEYSHIFIVPLVSLYLVWVRRMRLRHCRPTGRIIGPILVAAGWGIGSLGFYKGIQSFWHGGAVLVVLGCMLSVLGKNVVFRFFPALAVLIFLVPAPVRLRLAIATPLQRWTAYMAEKLMDIGGVTNVEATGNVLRINGKPVTIAEACNGLRMLFSLIMVCFAFCFALPLRNFVRILILLASPLAATFCNVVRVLPTIWLYGYKPAYADAFHVYAGWAMFLVAFLMLYSIIKVLQWAMVPVNEYTLAAQDS
ncbi:MAG: exosortase/archaeosortase family protein [Planctomycetota bacterium]|nr:exosortase/archaeosortase family protein [Planctomycetota bacterium]